MWDDIGALARYHGDVPPEVRVLKLAGYVGEACQALISVHGWNRRKGQHATEDDLLDELADVMITAGVAVAGFTADPGCAGDVLTRRLATVMARPGLDPAPDAGRMRHWTASAIVIAPDDRVLLVDQTYWQVINQERAGGKPSHSGARPDRRCSGELRNHRCGYAT